MIKYHGTPLTPIDAMIRAFKGRHAMVSYERPDQIGEACEVCQSVVLDNGAFTAWKHGRKHDFAGYLAWAAKWLKHPAVDWCVIPDVIDGDEADKKRHGTDNAGERHPLAKFTEEDIRRIREAALFGATQRTLASAYGTKQGWISQIVARKVWRHVP